MSTLTATAEITLTPWTAENCRDCHDWEFGEYSGWIAPHGGHSRASRKEWRVVQTCGEAWREVNVHRALYRTRQSAIRAVCRMFPDQPKLHSGSGWLNHGTIHTVD